MLALQLNEKDNVAVVFQQDVHPGDTLEVRLYNGTPLVIKARDNVPYGHKIAIETIVSGEHVVKYGEVIGGAVRDIPAGSHVHVHNVCSLRARGDLEE